MGDYLLGTAVGVMVGILLVITQDVRISEYKVAIDACQKDLPRAQTCKIIAVPDSRGDVK